MTFLDAAVFLRSDRDGFSTSETAMSSEKKPMYRRSEGTVFIETADSGFELPASENLLDALIDSGHEVDYQCRGGYCGACRTTVISGEVEYDELPLAHVNHDEILPCCCRVKEPLRLDVKLREIDEDKQGNLFETPNNPAKE